VQGHYAITFGNALGAEVTAFSRQEDKLADAKKLGAAHAVHAVGDSLAEPYALEFDLIISTADVTEKFPLDAYMTCVPRCPARFSPSQPSSRFLRRLIPPCASTAADARTQDAERAGQVLRLRPARPPFPGAPGHGALDERRLLCRLNRAQMLALLQLAADKGLRPWVFMIPMKDVATALQNVNLNLVRYRDVLTANIDGPPGLDAAEAAAKEKTLLQSAKEAVGRRLLCESGVRMTTE
jgi:alcohol dehydrogenase (NADP+)